MTVASRTCPLIRILQVGDAYAPDGRFIENFVSGVAAK
jgi:hypothetical protein